MFHRYSPLHYEHLFVSDSDTESDEICSHSKSQEPKRNGKKKRNNDTGKKGKAKQVQDEDGKVGEPLKADPDTFVELATKYQEIMEKIPIPETPLYKGMFVTWVGLAKSLKNLHKQPLHYHTYKHCQKWDSSRFGSKFEGKPMEEAMTASQAEYTIWTVEWIYRTGIGTSPIELARNWYEDPEYRVFVDEVIQN